MFLFLALSGTITGVQENIWARLRDSRTPTRVRFTQPSPHIFLHFRLAMCGYIPGGRSRDNPYQLLTRIPRLQVFRRSPTLDPRCRQVPRIQ